MNAWAFNEDRLEEALALWFIAIGPRDERAAVRDFLLSKEAAKLRIVEGARLVPVAVDPAAPWPFPGNGSREVDAVGTDGGKATTEKRKP